MEFHDLINNCCNGSEKAWKIFIKEFHPLISGAVERICSYDSEDVIQNVYEKIISNDYKLLKQFNGCYEQFLIYLKNISKNTALSYLKKSALIMKHTTDLDEFFENVEDTKPSIESMILAEEDLLILKRAISQLKPDNREIILFLSQGYKYHEIASLLGIPINTCLTRANRAKKILKNLLKSEIKFNSQETII